MSNFGFTELRLVNPYEVAFREARSAVKAHKVLEKASEYPDRRAKPWPTARWSSAPPLSVIARWSIRCSGWNSAAS